MKQSARLRSIEELLTYILDADNKAPADNIFVDYCRTRKFMGSHDRKYLGDSFFEILRFYHGYANALKGALTPRLLVLTYWAFKNGLSFDVMKDDFANDPRPYSQRYGIKLPNEHEKTIITKALSVFSENQIIMPKWSLPYFNDLPGNLDAHLKALHQQAPFDIRINPFTGNRTDVLDFFKNNGIVAEATDLSPFGIRLKNRIPLQELSIWKKGIIEVQDEGAQLVSLFANVKPGENVLDYCAGAGGKTLLMSALMHNKGRLVATDLLPWRLKQGVKRYRRAGVHNVQAKELNDTKWWKRHHNYFDCVLIDVPCSGSGTWRRNPDLKITFTQKDLKELLVKQQDILETAKKYIRPGGLFVYATCSIWRVENHDQIKRFLDNNPEFSLEPIGENNPEIIKKLKTKQDAEGLQLTPLDHQTDGFFMSVMRKEL